MTKSEMRRLRFQRKYTNNEAYEKDKEALIDKQLILGNLDIVCLLQQSKWVGSDNQPLTLLKDVDTTTIPS